MIPQDHISEWRDRAPWNENFQVEQDLIISRALTEIFSDHVLAKALAFRGGTALYQRRKGRDLFDLAIGLADERSNAKRIVGVFLEYMEQEGHRVTRAMFERNLAEKLDDPQFGEDMSALLRLGYEWRPTEAAQTVSRRLVPLLPGKAWKG